MKSRKVGLACAMVVASAVLAACEDQGPPEVMVTILTAADTLLPTDTLQFKASVTGGDPAASSAIAWTTTNTSVLAIDSKGAAVAVGPGSATVSASARGGTASVDVTVIEITLAENAVVADGALTLTSDSASNAAGNMEFQNDGNVQIDVGDVLVGSEGEAFIRRVQTVNTAGNTVSVTTTQASLPDAVENLAMDISEDFSLADAAQMYAAGGPSMAPAMPRGMTLQPDGTIQFNQATFQFGATGPLGLGGAINVTVNGSLDILFGNDAWPGKPAFKIEGKIKDFELKRFVVKITTRMVFDATATATVSGNPTNNDFSGRITTPSRLTPTIGLTNRWNPKTQRWEPSVICTAVGPLPVCYKITLKIPAYVEMWASGPGTIQQNINIDLGARLGGKFSNGKWSPILEPFGPGASASTQADEPLEMRMRFGVIPQIEILLYDVAGPFVGLDGWADVTLGTDTWEAWVLAQAGLDFTMGLRAQVMGILLAEASFDDNLWKSSVFESRAAVAELRLAPNPLNVVVQEQAGLSAVAFRLSDGANMGTASGVEWSTSDPTVASVNSGGLVSGVKVGTTQLQARMRNWPTVGGVGRVNVTPEALMTLTPGSIEASHTVGVTGCPQSLGNITITNVSDGELTWKATVDTPQLNLGNERGNRLKPGASANVRIVFTCASAESFEGVATIKVSREDDFNITQTIEVPVKVTVVGGDEETD